MDQTNAQLMEMIGGEIITTTIESAFNFQEKLETLQKGEKAMHHKEQQKALAYYNKIAAVIKNYHTVLLVGPSEAKFELINMLKDDHLFDKIKLETKQVDKMTDKQLQAFVKEYFFKQSTATV